MSDGNGSGVSSMLADRPIPPIPPIVSPGLSRNDKVWLLGAVLFLGGSVHFPALGQGQGQGQGDALVAALESVVEKIEKRGSESDTQTAVKLAEIAAGVETIGKKLEEVIEDRDEDRLRIRGLELIVAGMPESESELQDELRREIERMRRD